MKTHVPLSCGLNKVIAEMLTEGRHEEVVELSSEVQILYLSFFVHICPKMPHLSLANDL